MAEATADRAVWPPTEPLEAQLVAGPARLAVDLRGGGLRSLTVGARAVLDGYEAGEVPHGRRGGVLLPWPNRTRGGRWRWRGSDLQLEVPSPDSPNAIHGLVSWQPWQVLAATGDAVTVGTVVEPRPGYPFRLAAAIDHALAPDRLTVTVRVRNAGTRPAPFGVGMHPYLAVGAEQDGDVGRASLTLPARTRLELDGDADGWARVRLDTPAGSVELAVDRSWGWLQAFTGDTLPPGERRRSVAVEPMTCPPNALADDVDLVVLDPGGEWAGTWTLSWAAA
jgi:aldose 1-epimerase